MFSKDATEDEINAALDYLEIMGKAPVVTDASIAGLEADAKNRVDNGVPVIKPFPVWTDADYVAAQEKVVKEYNNVDEKMFESYFDATSSAGLHTEEPGSTQDMYAELTSVLQAVITDKDADVPALMKQANENYQKILDDMQ
jgi:multiple sugar transport system substrate-binding protein